METSLEKLTEVIEKDIYVSEAMLRVSEDTIQFQKMQLRYGLMQVKPDLVEQAYSKWELDIIFNGNWEAYKNYLEESKKGNGVRIEA